MLSSEKLNRCCKTRGIGRGELTAALEQAGWKAADAKAAIENWSRGKLVPRPAPADLDALARTLGATPWQAFWRISFPLAWRNILSGIVLMWARGLSEFGAVVILAYHPMIAPVLLYERFESFGLKYARPVAAIIIVICLLTFVLLRVIAGQRGDE